MIWTEERIAEWQTTGLHPTVAVWTPAQTAEFLQATRDHRLYAAFHLIALRGLRRAETSALRWADIDLHRGTLLITHTTQRVAGRLMQCPPKTNTSRRTVILDRTTVKELHRHYARQQAEAARLRINPSGFVFTNRRGQPLNPDHLYREFITATHDAGLPPIRLHDLRHSAASHALQADAPLKVIQDQLGHASIVLTADTHISVEPDLARDATEATARLVLKAARRIPGTRRLHHRIPTSARTSRAGKAAPRPHAQESRSSGVRRPESGPTSAPPWPHRKTEHDEETRPNQGPQTQKSSSTA